MVIDHRQAQNARFDDKRAEQVQHKYGRRSRNHPGDCAGRERPLRRPWIVSVRGEEAAHDARSPASAGQSA